MLQLQMMISVDEPKFLSLINSSGWDTTKCINSNFKHEFLYLLIKEAILKRIVSMDALANGLEQLGIATLLRNRPTITGLFTHMVSPLGQWRKCNARPRKR